MGKIRFIIFIFFVSLCSAQLSAQYTLMIGGKDEKGRTMDYTPFYFATKKGMFQSGYYLSFQKIEDTLFIYAEYVAWNITNLNPHDISSTIFLFRDGFELIVPTTIKYEKTSTPFNENGIEGSWSHYFVRSRVSEEQMALFSNKPLLSIAHNFEGLREFDAFVPKEKSIYIAMNVECFLSGKVISKKDVLERFNNSETNKNYNDEKWDF